MVTLNALARRNGHYFALCTEFIGSFGGQLRQCLKLPYIACYKDVAKESSFRQYMIVLRG